MSGNYSCREEAESAARIESYFNKMAETYEGFQEYHSMEGDIEIPFVTEDGQKFTIMDGGVFRRSTQAGDTCVKALVIKDEAGRVFIHFNGTGDGNWEYNADNAYGTDDVSQMHQWSKDYIDYVLGHRLLEGEDQIYVTGHSQGGNNAQYAAMSATDAYKIKNCIALDAPGFSDSEVAHLRQELGEAEYLRRVEKMYAYNGDSDYVSCLGQSRIISDEHTYIIKINQDGYHAEYCDNFFVYYHMANYMLDPKTGTFSEVRPFDPGSQDDGESSFRVFMREFIPRLDDYPPEEQNKIAHAIMKLIENITNDDKENTITSTLTAEELEYIKEKVIPLLMDTIKDEPDKVAKMLEMFVPVAVQPLIRPLIDGLNDLPEADRLLLIQTIATSATIKDNMLDVDWTRILQHGRLATVVIEALRAVFNAVVNHPENLQSVIDQYKDLFFAFAKEHPFQTVAVVMLLVFNFEKIAIAAQMISTVVISAGSLFVIGVTIVNLVVDFCSAVFSKLEAIYKDLVSFMQNYIIPALKGLAAWIRNIFNPGAAYAQSNPALRIDTGRFHELSSRVGSVNRRLRNLDRALDSLYWQVGLLDLIPLLSSDLLVGCSPTLSCVQSYLSNTASAFDSVENQVQGMFG